MDISSEHETIIIGSLVPVFEPLLIMVFGSAAKGSLRADSDIDIAFLTKQSSHPFQVYLTAQRLAKALGKEVDLVDLAQASTVLCAQIVHTGEILYCRDKPSVDLFFMQALKSYAKLNEERQCILDAVQESGEVYHDQ